MTKWDLFQECKFGLTSIDNVYHIHAIKEENHMIIPIVAHKKMHL